MPRQEGDCAQSCRCRVGPSATDGYVCLELFRKVLLGQSVPVPPQPAHGIASQTSYAPVPSQSGHSMNVPTGCEFVIAVVTSLAPAAAFLGTDEEGTPSLRGNSQCAAPNRNNRRVAAQ